MTARPPRAPVRPTGAPGTEATAWAMGLLRTGVPLSLIVDLACGPRSQELLAVERPAGPAAG